MPQPHTSPTDPADEPAGLLRPPAPVPLADQAREWLAAHDLRLGRVLTGVAVALALTMAGWWFTREPAPPVEASLPQATVPGGSTPMGSGPALPGGEPGTTTTTSQPAADVVVHAAGAVVRPGVYEVPAEARVSDVLAAAGGLAPDADGDRLNLAAPVADGQRVYVPRRGQEQVPDAVTGDGAPPAIAPSGQADGAASRSEGPVDLNSATAEQLDALPGVGPATAEAIIGYRDEHGGFRSVDELLEVRGIGDAKLADLRDRVTV